MSFPTSDRGYGVRSLHFNRKNSKPVTLHMLHGFDNAQQLPSKVFEGLGKATKRGVRTCPKCGVINGTRGLKCKNEDCKYDFKQLVNGAVNHSSQNKILACDEDIAAELSAKFRVLRLLSEEKLYSIERYSGNTGDFSDWGFVYLPLMEEVNEVVGIEGRDAVAYQLMAFCYMRDCTASSLLFGSHARGRKRKHGDVLQQEQLCCDHVKASFLAKDCINSICRIDASMFDSFSLPTDVGLQLSKLTGTDLEANPMVQKLSDVTYIVRGLQDKEHPIGYTYVFYSNQNDDKEDDIVFSLNSFDEVSLTCWCGLKLDLDCFKEPSCQPCLQLCICLLALSSDPKHSKRTYPLLTAMDDYYKQVNLVQESLFVHDVMSESEKSSHARLSEENKKQMAKAESMLDEDVIAFLQKNSRANQKQEEEQLFVREKSDCSHSKEERLMPTFGHIVTDGQLPLISASDFDIADVSVSFNEWMTFVMESIEESMHYQSEGRPPSLIFHIDHKFFNVILQRITSSAHKKKRLPDSIETIAILPPLHPPHGTFNKYTWRLHNSNHVQQIFSTSLQNKLPLCRCFVENKDGTYSKFEKSNVIGPKYNYGKPHIQPFHLKTQLKIGYDPEDSQCSVSTPFIIEWIPNLFKRSKVGEMKLTFQIKHYRHGKLV